MQQSELERLRAYYADVSDEDVARAHRAGPGGFREPEIWDLVAAEYARRAAAGGLQDVATPESEPPVAGQEEPPLKGVAGWLLFLCVSLTVLGPLRALATVFTAFGQSDLSQVPAFGMIALLDTVVIVALMGFSIYAGIGLWTVRPRAVQTAKRYLWCALGYQVVAMLVAAVLWLPTGEDLVLQIARHTLPTVVYVAVWYSYLRESKRVRATYES